ncbi:chemotaxis protein CheW [Treponema parvum]|uniref:Chemotaxis protein CheW n=1 Tax=Treponema parvum TaxID=138851 RepID=A0A975F4P8_9SPIR|nr:CheR family methyltransferase [Treponema parvum]QTQ14407.1 chemotaxis protein CheW [Treponema parvum]
MDASNELAVKNQTDTELLDKDDENSEKEKISAVDFKMITFSLAGKDYAIDIMKIKEIAKVGHFTYVPNVLPFVVGVYNLRGDIIPIIDFRLFFNIDVPAKKIDELENLLIVTVGEQTFGAVVDEIHSVVGIQKDTIQPPHPLFGDISIRYIYGVVESGRQLYILLDIDRIFSGKIDAEIAKPIKPVVLQQPSAAAPAGRSAANAVPSSSPANAASAAASSEASDKDYNFIVHDLQAIEEFYVSHINESWVKRRFAEWVKLCAGKTTQLQNKEKADEFLGPFWSKGSSSWWPRALADNIYKLLPDNVAKQIIVWNIGCGKGHETYSLACLLKKRYPEAKIRIYAHDKDLLNVSNAPLLSIEASFANDWYAPYVTHKANGEYTFTQEIKDSIMFEYHDCSNTNVLPMVDIIFARDVVSLLPQNVQDPLIDDFAEKLKGNGIVVLGENESLSARHGWEEKMIDSLFIYSKQ